MLFDMAQYRPGQITSVGSLLQVRVDRLQRVRRMQMAHYLDALRRAVAPPPESVAPPFTEMPGMLLLVPHASCQPCQAAAPPLGSSEQSMGCRHLVCSPPRMSADAARQGCMSVLDTS